MTINTESTHPTAEDQLEAIDEERERIEKEENRLRNGEIALPWPHSSSIVVAIGGLNLVAGGGALALDAIQSTSDAGMSIAAALLLLSGGMLVIYARWMRQHFELGEQPTYDTLAADGGDGDD